MLAQQEAPRALNDRIEGQTMLPRERLKLRGRVFADPRMPVHIRFFPIRNAPGAAIDTEPSRPGEPFQPLPPILLRVPGALPLQPSDVLAVWGSRLDLRLFAHTVSFIKGKGLLQDQRQ